MFTRLLRLTRRSAAIHKESGSLRSAAAFFLKSFVVKARAGLLHASSLLRLFLPRTRSRTRQRLDRLRDHNKIIVCVSVSGGLGDLVVAGRFLRDLQREVEPFCFDVFCASPSLVEWIFRDIKGFEQAFPDSLESFAAKEYDLSLRINQAVSFRKELLRWNRLKVAPKLLNSLRLIGKFNAPDNFGTYIKYHPKLDNGLARKAVFLGHSRRLLLQNMAGVDYGGDSYPISYDTKVLSRFGLEKHAFITIHNGFDTNFIVTGSRATKCYPHFYRVVQGIKAAQPNLRVVQVGGTTSEPIPGVDLNLIGQTDLKEVAGLLRFTALHLDNEGGLVHLAACYGRRSLVVFGPTPSDYFGYPENINVDPQICGGCWWIDDLWMSRCPRGIGKPECLETQSPEKIIDFAIRALADSSVLTMGQHASAHTLDLARDAELDKKLNYSFPR